MRALLGGDDNHTVGTSRTIDGCSRYILQHFYALNIRWIQKSQRIKSGIITLCTCACRGRIVVNYESVNHIEGLIATSDGVTTTDADDAGCTRLTTGSGHVQTCHSSLQGTLDGGVVLLQQLIAY